jgi:LacI family transcriptional regulator
VQRILRRQGLTLIAFETEDEAEGETQAVDVLLRSGARALVAASAGGLGPETLERLARRDVRVIHFDDRPASDELSSVTLADREDVRELTRQLLDHGHRRIGFVSGALDGSSGRDRLQGYHEALDEAGVSADPDLVCGFGWSHVVGRQAGEHLLALADRPTAILTAHPCTVVGVVEALRAARLQIPGDVSLATAFEADHIRYLDPPITCMTGCDERLGEAIARLVLADRYRPQQIVVRPTLALRDSVARVPVGA